MIPNLKKVRGSEDPDPIAVQDNVVEWSKRVADALTEITAEEYAFNDDVAGGNNYEAFANTDAGAYFPDITLVGSGSYDKRVRFQSAIGPNDKIVLEIMFGDAPGVWMPNHLYPYLTFLNYRFGIGLNRVAGSDTEIDVIFGASGARPESGVSATGENYDTTNKWRVRKSRY